MVLNPDLLPTCNSAQVTYSASLSNDILPFFIIIESSDCTIEIEVTSEDAEFVETGTYDVNVTATIAAADFGSGAQSVGFSFKLTVYDVDSYFITEEPIEETPITEEISTEISEDISNSTSIQEALDR